MKNSFLDLLFSTSFLAAAMFAIPQQSVAAGLPSCSDVEKSVCPADAKNIMILCTTCAPDGEEYVSARICSDGKWLPAPAPAPDERPAPVVIDEFLK